MATILARVPLPQKLLLCLSHTQTIIYLDAPGKRHDDDVQQWKNKILSTMSDVSCISWLCMFHFDVFPPNFFILPQHISDSEEPAAEQSGVSLATEQSGV